MKKSILLKFGNNVRNQRQRKGITQEELAFKAGVHRTYVGMIERGEKNITLTNIAKICKALDIQISKIFKDLDNGR